jgi:diguanylate cyclase
LLKSGLQTQSLQKELEEFSSALMLLEDKGSSHDPDAYLLFEFLSKQYPRFRAELELIQEKYESHQFKNSQALIVALLELTDENLNAPELPQDAYAIIAQHLLSLLEDIDIPVELVGKVEQIKTSLLALDGGASLGSVLDDTVALLLSVKKHLFVEQLEMADFLAKLTEQLDELALKASGVYHASENVISKQEIIGKTVSMQMADLQNKSANATQLEPLKQLVHNQLSSIAEQINLHSQQEQIAREQLKLQLQSLTEKVQDMEVESNELKSKLDIAQNKAVRDPLTRIPNRLALDDRLAEEIARSRRNGMPLAMLVWDIDFFKKINDTYGHKSGDKALMAIAVLLQKHCRQTDFVARFGGEEFVMLLPNTDANAALIVADKLRENVQRTKFKADGDTLSISLSCGISELLASDNKETLFERADKALYQAKQSGRNRCIVS